MRTRRAWGLLCVAMWLFWTGHQHLAQASEKREDGLTVEEFRRFAQALPRLPGRIETIRFFRGPHGLLPEGIALLVGVKKQGWQVFVFMREPNRDFKLVWNSGKLEYSFNVSSPQELQVFDQGDSEIVQFEGCAPHLCNDVFSILIYVPSKRMAFTAKYDGSVTYSPELQAPENRRYKEWLERQVRERLGRNP